MSSNRLIAASLILFSGSANALEVLVRDTGGAPLPNGFRWQLEEDNTFGSVPGVRSPAAPWNPAGPNPSYSLAVNVHKSHQPTVCVGDTAPADNAASPPLPQGWAGAPSQVTIGAANCPGFNASARYMVSILPWHDSAPGVPPLLQTGFTMGGRNVAAGEKSVTVLVHRFPVPTGLITILIFEDSQPINGAFDSTAEHGLANFSLIVSDPVGKVLQDAFGYPLGTTYKYKYATADGRPADASGKPIAQGQQPEWQLDGNGLPVVSFMGDGTIRSCPGGDPAGYSPYQKANCIDPWTLAPMGVGEIVLKNLPADKYSIEPLPPPELADMVLTATTEGTKGDDAWVRPGEPRFNISLGNVDWLLSFGFVKPMPMALKVPPNQAAASISGRIVVAHDSHPPLSPGLSPGLPVRNAYVGLSNNNGNDEQVYAAPCDPATGNFNIANVPAGTYTLTIWDRPINNIMDFRTITVTSGQRLRLGPVAVYSWFSNLSGTVFNDPGANGFPAGGVPPRAADGIPNIGVNLRYTDGSLYGATTTGPDGTYSFPQLTSWWRYVVAEVETTRFKATGMTAIVDQGGQLQNDKFGRLGIHPQMQPNGLAHRTERSNKNGNGEVLTQAINLYQDMNSRIDWGKTAYAPGENGGIRGIVYYATTRTEEDPQKARPASWEPAVPNVQLLLFKAKQDQVNGNALQSYWVADGPALQTVLTDSWNDNQPTGCLGDPQTVFAGMPELVNGFAIPDCAETLVKWDQIRNGVFDGAYLFDSYCAGGVDLANGKCAGNAAPTPIPAGDYLVQVIPPPGYKTLEWGDRNIEFGDPKIPFLVAPPPCVGSLYDIPQYHTLFPDQQVATDTTVTYGPWKPGMQAPLCDRKVVALNEGANATADFRIFTFVPKAARIWGTVWNDLMLEFNPRSPNASGNLGAQWMPVAVKDYRGVEVARFYTDQWGHFDGLVPANYDIAPPIPLGLVLALYTIAPNDPGPILDTRPGSPTNGQYITDPWFNPAFSQGTVRKNWEFYPGRTTFIDTIVLPIAAFAGNRVPLNCAATDKTPELKQVSEVVIPQVAGGFNVTISSKGKVEVPNPNYDPANPKGPPLIVWDHGFGPPGGKVTVGGTPITGLVWSADGATIAATIPPGVSGQLVITRGDSGIASTAGITFHIADNAAVVDVFPPPGNCEGLACAALQPAIDAAPNGAILRIHPGRYQENVNLYKPITLQGYGAAVTVIDGTAALANLLLKRRQFQQLQDLLGNHRIEIAVNQASDFVLEEGAGILVSGCNPQGADGCPGNNSFFATGASARIDGLGITGATDAGGGILINSFTNRVSVTNNDINANAGSLGGGIRAGESGLIGPGNPKGTALNPNLVIDHNRIAQNGSLVSGGGGIALFAGADDYRVTSNFICGNLSAQYGGGIGHFGLSNNGLIANNKIVSNESVDEGGGVHIGGDSPAGLGLSVGSGSVTLVGNLIQGNKGGDDGGGLRTRRVNGLDVLNNPRKHDAWYKIDVFNNLVVNNSSADHGGGMSFDDTVKLTVASNTIAHNDATSTGSDAFGGPCVEGSPAGQRCPGPEGIGGLTSSIPQVGGIASFVHSTELLAALRAGGDQQTFSNPVLVDNIIWHNRSFFWNALANSGLGQLRPMPGSGYWDLAVYGTGRPQLLSPTHSILTSGTGASPSGTNLIGVDPRFAGSYLNLYQATSKGTSFGNFVVATFTPNGMVGDYHVRTGSPAVGSGGPLAYPMQATDYDGKPRKAPLTIGATGAVAPAAPLKANVVTSTAEGSVDHE